jgi:hypothetical protein
MASFGVHTTKLRCDHPQVCVGPPLSEAWLLWQASATLFHLWYGAGPTADDTPEPSMQQVSSDIESLRCFRANASQQFVSCTLRLTKACTMRQVADRHCTAAWPAEAGRYSAVFHCRHASHSDARILKCSVLCAHRCPRLAVGVLERNPSLRMQDVTGCVKQQLHLQAQILLKKRQRSWQLTSRS